MTENVRHPVRIDLNEFKLHIHLKNKIALSLHFNSPSRRFYLSLIALVVMEMKKRGKIVPIPLEKHLGLLALINETVGGSAGSSERRNLLTRIYRKWKNALPNLEEAPLFKVLGRKKEWEEVNGRTYLFSDSEKDHWANLFAYVGSDENVRLKFAVDKIGSNLDDIIITLGDFRDGEAWEHFLSTLRGWGEKAEAEPAQPAGDGPRVQGDRREEGSNPRPNRVRRAVWVAAIPVILGLIIVAVWKMVPPSSPLQVASIKRMAYPLPDKPSIAVLPLVNLNGDPKEDYISDGLTEQIITSLSSFHRLFVIARNSTFSYKGKPVNVQKAAEDLGVHYVLEGSVQKSGDKVRITAQLVDALTGRHVWSERYDREMKDFFALQDEITIKILNGMKVELTEGPLERHYVKVKTDNLKAYEKNYQGVGFYRRFTKQDNEAARRLFEEALSLDPKYYWPNVMLGYTHFFDARMGWSDDPAKSLQQALAIAQKTIALDESLDPGHSLLSLIYLVRRQYDRAIGEAERAVTLNPNGPFALSNLAAVVGCSGRWDQAILYQKQSMRLNPIHDPWDHYLLGRAYFMTGKYGEALAELKNAIQANPNFLIAHLILAASYGSMDRGPEAAATAQEVLRINPRFTLEAHAKTLPYKNKADVERELVALRQAGLK